MINGQRLKHGTVANYVGALKLLLSFEEFKGQPLRIMINIRCNKKQIQQEHNYWKKFYREFSDFLFQQKNCYDNFVGAIFKILKCCFRYLKHEKYLQIQECC